jgi:hypothetical protein
MEKETQNSKPRFSLGKKIVTHILDLAVSVAIQHQNEILNFIQHFFK